MNTSTRTRTLGPRRKWRRNQKFGSVLFALNKLKGEFYERSVQMEVSHEKLQASKKELSEIIAEVQKLQQTVKSEEDRCQESIKQLEDEVDEAELFYWDSPGHSDIQTLHTWAKIEIATARREIRETELELNSESPIVLTNNNSNERSSTMSAVPIAINLSDIDELGTLEEGDSIKIDYSRKCCICLKKDIDCVLYGCAHQCCCSTCISDLQKNEDPKCPVCQRTIHKVIKTYYV